MAHHAQVPRTGIIAELLEIARGDWELVKQAGRVINGKLYVSRNLLIKIVEEQNNAKGNTSPHG